MAGIPPIPWQESHLSHGRNPTYPIAGIPPIPSQESHLSHRRNPTYPIAGIPPIPSQEIHLFHRRNPTYPIAGIPPIPSQESHLSHRRNAGQSIISVDNGCSTPGDSTQFHHSIQICSDSCTSMGGNPMNSGLQPVRLPLSRQFPCCDTPAVRRRVEQTFTVCT